MEDRTSELTLRPFRLSDIDNFMVWATDDLVSRFCRFKTYTSREAGIAYLKEQAIPHPWLRAICLDDRAIGSISVTQGSGGALCRGELGYVLASKYWGQGLTPHAVKMVLSSVFKDISKLERVEALVDAENVRSQRVLEKVGFVRDGFLRKYERVKGRTINCMLYSFLSTDTIK
ncbi:uncharacterized protein LOC105420302 [Amborella trichopoda]|uniref:uncharacterized protein LOC105420302 n=1 Tax=Amborella trichopoda TaxID=13333 RepID=UPI0005D39C2C|nr:uncharacterized protein LOC105420302 [Amborella trichopoda]|eukprot:XP_020520178.1 uncharacterized protein LOC105420302 [Amborella trichopoda]